MQIGGVEIVPQNFNGFVGRRGEADFGGFESQGVVIAAALG